VTDPERTLVSVDVNNTQVHIWPAGCYHGLGCSCPAASIQQSATVDLNYFNDVNDNVI